MLSRFLAALALTLAVAATFASGAHEGLALAGGTKPLKLPERPFPSVSPKSVEHGCAVWGEALATCLAEPEAAEFSYGNARKM
ncbi:MAG: hypothetical protein AB7L90_21765 [Hyphomicrobiaceae bacterium]